LSKVGPMGALAVAVWKASTLKFYGYRTEGTPYSREAVAKRRAEAPFAMPASAEYYRRIDEITAASARRHVWYVCPSNCDDPSCNFCRGGLSMCVTCGQAEGDLQPTCPGPRA
jgi:hypothetical protein